MKPNKTAEMVGTMQTEGHGLYRVTTFFAADALYVTAKAVMEDGPLSVEEIGLMEGMTRMLAATRKGKGPMCGCCDHVFSFEGEPPMAFVLMHGETDHPTMAVFSVVCERCSEKPGFEMQVVRTLHPDARVVHNTVGRC